MLSEALSGVAEGQRNGAVLKRLASDGCALSARGVTSLDRLRGVRREALQQIQEQCAGRADSIAGGEGVIGHREQEVGADATRVSIVEALLEEEGFHRENDGPERRCEPQPP